MLIANGPSKPSTWCIGVHSQGEIFNHCPKTGADIWIVDVVAVSDEGKLDDVLKGENINRDVALMWFYAWLASYLRCIGKPHNVV